MQICIIYLLTECPQSLGELKPAEACCCFQNALVGCLGLIPLCGAEPCVHSPHAGLADSEINISPPVSLLSWQCHLCTLCSPWCGDKVSFFARTMVSHTLWCSELPNTALALPHWDFFQCQDLLFSHKALTSVLGCMGDRSWKCLTLLLQSNPCCF